MFLFNKKTRNIIKYAWGFFAILIILSMVFAYSGFTSLTATPQPIPTEDIPPEILAELQQQSANNMSPEERAALERLQSGEVELLPNPDEASTTEETTETPPAPPAPPLKLEI